MGWHILKKPEALWVRILKAKYFPRTSFLDSVQVSGSSLVWQGISKAKELFREQVCFVPRNGETLNIGSHAGFKPTWRLNATLPTNISRVADLVDLDSGEWNIALLLSLFSDDTVDHILELPPPHPQRLDAVIWSADPKGDFTV